MEKLEIVKCENGVGVWEVVSDSGCCEVFDTRSEAEERLRELKERENQNGKS
tara:strand:- start:129 stop:284 length:156 start_codon:yes stop_codon:yes gene_type:complete